MVFPIVILRSFAWAAIMLPIITAVAFFYQEPIFAFLNIEGFLIFPEIPELIIMGLGGLLTWAVLGGLALFIEASLITARNSQETTMQLAQVQDAVTMATLATSVPPAMLKESVKPAKAPKGVLSFDDWR